MKKIICLFKGHKSITKLNEDEYCIYDKACERCGQVLMFPATYKNTPCPSWRTKKEWDKFQKEYFDEIRNSINERILIK